MGEKIFNYKKMTLAFIVPFKPKSVSKNWDFDNLLLQRTLKSISSQTVKNFKVYVVCTEKPNFEIENDNVILLFFKEKTFDINELEDFHLWSKYFPGEFIFKSNLDKELKLAYAIKQARKDKCKYIMAVDADDLISNKISDFVESNSKEYSVPGWFLDKGYLYEEGNKYLLKQNKNFSLINGSTHIVRTDLIPKITSLLPKFSELNFFNSHGFLKTRIWNEFNLQLLELPFRGVIYVFHSTNSSNIRLKLNSNKIKKTLKKALKFKMLDTNLIKSFGYYKI